MTSHNATNLQTLTDFQTQDSATHVIYRPRPEFNLFLTQHIGGVMSYSQILTLVCFSGHSSRLLK